MAYLRCKDERCGYVIHRSRAKGLLPKCDECGKAMQGRNFNGIPSHSLWKKVSRLEWKPRSAELVAIDTAIESYHVGAVGRLPEDELGALTDLMTAISTWCSKKVKKYGVTNRRHPDYNQGDVEGERVPHPLDKGAWKQSIRAPMVEDLIIAAAGEAHANQAMVLKQNQWDIEYTNPALGPQLNYKYIVAAVTDSPGALPSYHSDLLRDPAHIRGLVSATYITDQINTVWSQSGFILTVPPRNIFAAGILNLAAKSQIGHFHMARKYVEVLDLFLNPRFRPQPQNSLLSPDGLIENMQMLMVKYRQMNELAILGQALGAVGQPTSRVQIAGIFIMEPQGEVWKEALSEERKQAYKRLHDRYDIPIVNLPLANTSVVKAR